MLKLIDKLLGPELPRALRAMGHGDSVAIAPAPCPKRNERLKTRPGVGSGPAIGRTRGW